MIPSDQKLHYAENCREVLAELNEAKAEGRLLIYLDEITFTKRSLLAREWSSKNCNLSVDQKEVYIGYRSVIATITEEKGVGLYSIYMQSINADDFIEYLKKLRAKNCIHPISLFMDRLNVHRSTKVKPLYAQLNISPIYNVAYSPATNPIEAVFSKVKAVFCRQRANCLVNKLGFNFDKEIRDALRTITTDHCSACVRKSLFLL